MTLESLQGRWYGRHERPGLRLEEFLDVKEELFVHAVQFHEGGPFRTRQAVYALVAAEGDELDLSLVRLIQDGADRTGEFEASRIRGRARREGEALLAAFSEPDGPRPGLGEARRLGRPLGGRP